MSLQYLHFDSASSIYLLDANNTSGNKQNSMKAQYTMNQSFTNVKRVHLKSVEFPIGFCNIRTGSTNTLNFTLNGTSYMVTLLEKNYTTILSLLIDLTTACIGKVSNVTLTFNLSSSLVTPNRINISFSGSTTTTSFSIIDTNLSKYVLGFRSSDVLVGNIYTASCNFNLNFDNYINMSIPTLSGVSSNQNGIISCFKVPLNTSINQVYYYFDGTSFTQSVDIIDSRGVFNNIIVIFTDKFGNNLNNYGLDVSFTLLLEFNAKYPYL